MACYNIAQLLSQYAAHVRSQLEADISCSTCFSLPLKPVTGPCGHSRCTSCVIASNQCPCGMTTNSTDRNNIKITNILQSIREAAPTRNIVVRPRLCDNPQPSSSSSVPGQQHPKSERSSETELMQFRPTERWHIRTKIFPLERALLAYWLIKNGSVLEGIGQLAYASVTRSNISLHTQRILERVVFRCVDETNIEQLQNLKRTIEKQNFSMMGINPADVECPVCLERLQIPITTSCGHTFCKSCLIGSIADRKLCPLCRHNLSDDKFKIDDFLYKILGFGLSEDRMLALPVPRHSHDIRSPRMHSILHYQSFLHRPLVMELRANGSEIIISLPTNRNAGEANTEYITILLVTDNFMIASFDSILIVARRRTRLPRNRNMLRYQ